MKTAVVHDWLPIYSGAEQVVAEIMRVLGPSDLFTLYDFLTEQDRQRLGARRVITSYLNRLPLKERFYRHSFPLCPGAMEDFDLSDYDLVVSSSAAFAKGVIVHPHQRHIAYVHTLPRYAWDQTFEYLDRTAFSGPPFGMILRNSLHKLRIWDARTAHGPDVLLANSTVVQRRIEQIYGRQSVLLHPPVDVDAFPLCEEKDDYYIVASRMVPYKRMDLVVGAFAQMPDRRLVVAGDGPELGALKAIAGPNVTFSGRVPREELVDLVRRARAFLFASYEDFGIVMAEAQAAGTPVIAYGRGGAEDIVAPLGGPKPTGVLFDQRDVASIVAAVDVFESRRGEISAVDCRARAERFSMASFQRRFAHVVEAVTSPGFRRDAAAGLLPPAIPAGGPILVGARG